MRSAQPPIDLYLWDKIFFVKEEEMAEQQKHHLSAINNRIYNK